MNVYKDGMSREEAAKAAVEAVRFYSTIWLRSNLFILPQAILELLLIDYFVIPRLSLCAGVNVNIRFAYIADFAFDGSGRKVNDNIVTDLVIG